MRMPEVEGAGRGYLYEDQRWMKFGRRRGRSMISAILRRFLFVVAVFIAASTVFAGDRVVAVGDVHGAYDGLVSILQRAELIDDETHWIGGTSILVQTGDLFDRGVQLREVFELLMRIQDEAASAGGRVIVLLGNHEGMNLTDYYRDANPEVYVTFVDKKSEKRRKAGFKNYKKFWQVRSKRAGTDPPPFLSEAKEWWMNLYPPGRIEYTEAIGPNGQYGKWLRTLPVAVLLGDVLFVHGGVGPVLEGLSIAEINAKVAEELAIYDRTRTYMVERNLIPETEGLHAMLKIRSEQDPPDPMLAELEGGEDWLIISNDGPLWFRGTARWDEETEGANVAEMLAAVGAQRVVGGHTVQQTGRIEVRFDGTVFLIDTGMLSSHYMGGQASALVIEGGFFTAIYSDGSEELLVDESLANAA